MGPLPPLLSVAMDRQQLVVNCVGDVQRNQFLGVLIRTVGVRAAYHQRRQAVSLGSRQDQQLAAGLGGRVRTGWVQPVRLNRGARQHSAVNLIGTHLEEALDARRIPAG